MKQPHPQPPYEMREAYILTKEKWLELCEHLTIGCTNQKAFLDSLATHTPAAPAPIFDCNGCKHDNQDTCPSYGAIPTDGCKYFIDYRVQPATERLCDDCNILELEERLINLEQELKDAREQITQERGWDKGFEDGKTAALVDLNIICDQAHKYERERIKKRFFELEQEGIPDCHRRKCSANDDPYPCNICIFDFIMKESLRGGATEEGGDQ